MITVNRFNRCRKLRNDLVYRGDKATVKEAEDIRDLYKELREDLTE